ncbi:MAG TPA: hypothetical protein VKY37_12855 [Brumimicrobium sp.]|nr:hypothetical protein [Brumimicrobium sp.]
MTKYIILILSILCIQSSIGQVNPTLVDIPHEVFVNGGTNDFQQVLFKDETIAKKVKVLHAYDELDHEFTVQTHSFEQYWSRFEKQWHYIQFKESSQPLLIFTGLKISNDEREFVEIFNMKNERTQRQLFSDVGKLLAFKKHPFTGETILFVHKYPCCQSASHNIYAIRQIKDELRFPDRFFVGRDIGDMVGPFFPEKVNHDGKHHFLNKKTELRWSPAIVNENAFENWTESNLIIHYNEGAMYKILHDQDEWQFVLFFNGIAEEQSMMLNYTNFTNKGVYGWIKK